MDEGSAHTSLTLSTEHDSIYTYNITSEHCLPAGSQCRPHPTQSYEHMQTDVGHTRLHFHSYLKAAVKVDVTRFKELVPLRWKNMY